MSERTTVKEPEGKQFPLTPAGLHSAVCVDVWDVWTEERPQQYGGGLVDKVRLVWLITDEKDEETGDDLYISKMYTASLHEKANLRKDLASWRGRDFTDKERKAFDLEALIGVNCQLSVAHKVSETNGKTYANVVSIVPAAKGSKKFGVPDGFVRHRDKAKDDDSGTSQVTGDDIPF